MAYRVGPLGVYTTEWTDAREYRWLSISTEMNAVTLCTRYLLDGINELVLQLTQYATQLVWLHSETYT